MLVNEGFMCRLKFYFLLLQTEYKLEVLNTTELPKGKHCRNLFSGAAIQGGFEQWGLARTSSLVANAPSSKTDWYRRGTVLVNQVGHRSTRSHAPGIYVMDWYALFGSSIVYLAN